jgi:hypothetical protein
MTLQTDVRISVAILLRIGECGSVLITIILQINHDLIIDASPTADVTYR